MAKFTKSHKSGKPEKPYPTFPLYAHNSGRWAKKILGKTLFFGHWGRKQGNVVVQVDEIQASAREAQKEFDRQWPYLSEGRTAPLVESGEGITVAELCNKFLNSKLLLVESDELSLHSFSEYHRSCSKLIEALGENRRVDQLRPDDFEKLRSHLAAGVNKVTLKSKINRIRVILKYASDNELVDRPVRYGKAFDRPTVKMLRKAQNESNEKMFTAIQIRAMLDHTTDPRMRAMLLLAVNGAMGNTDVSSLPISAIHEESDGVWLVYPRPKTEVMRRIPLWKETAEALREAIKLRPQPAAKADSDLCFITSRGNRFVRMQSSKANPGTYLTINTVARNFENLMDKASIERKRGLGFYTLRHVFATEAGESLDQVAVNAIMGHSDESMPANYRHKITDKRLKAVTNFVHDWLFNEAEAEGGEA